MASRTPAPGAIVDNKYRLAERIGGGGMGHVFKAENVLAGRSVAIKFLHPELAENTELAQRFFQEAQAVNRIRHPNIVDVIDAGVGEMGPYIVMEHLEGEAVGTSLQRMGRFELDGAVATVVPILEALDAAHRVGIIHRDLKPENVFIAFDPGRGQAVVRLLDFGIAKVIDSNGPSPRTRTGVVFGTPDYLSPEQATGDAPIDGRSDLFAVGVLLYELLTGTRPFRAPTAVATAFRVVHAEAPTLAAGGVNVDSRLEAVVSRLLQKDPMKRYATAGEVARELEKFCPDPAKRVLALGRIININRRIALTPPHPMGGTMGSGANVPGVASPPPPPPASMPELDRPLPSAREPRSMSRFADLPATSMPHASTRVVPMAPSARNPVDGNQSRTEASHLTRGSLDVPQPAPRATSNTRLSTLTSAPNLGNVTSGNTQPAKPVRAVSARFPGMYQVRGAVLRSVDKAIIEDAGQKVRDQIIGQLPQRYADDFLNDSINALVAYDLEALDAYMDLATASFAHEPNRWRMLGRAAIGGELHNTVRSVLRPAPDLQIAIRRGISIWSRLFSFGSWKVGSSSPGRVLLHVSEFDPASHALRMWVVGVVEETARRATSYDVRVSIAAGEAAFSPELSCELS
ncbi:MAG TPA: serine/threonine-protein kinase [Polyangium sp.]|nr:serine/threonine-protein kinase [Polyangium sp.]